MRLLTCILLVLAITPTRGDDSKPASPIRAKLDAVTVLKKRLLGDLVRDYEAMEAEHLADDAKVARMKAVDDRMYEAITPSFDDLLDAASDHPDDPATIDALRFVAINSRGLTTGQVGRAISLMSRDHLRAPNISTASGPLWLHHDKPEAIALLRAIMLNNPSRLERGRACHDLAFLLKFRVESAERFRVRSPGVPFPAQWAGADLPAVRAEAIALDERSLSEFADVPVGDYAPGKTIGDLAQGELTALRDIQVGQTAPEIVGQDVDGHPMRLSDHRGKVVVLIFSGEWCGPCKAAAPHFRDLLKPEAQKTAPCVVLEVNTDATREPVRKAIAAGDITWPCWFDGGTEGPITLAWGISSFPSIFVLDPQGVIRSKGLRGETTAAAVAEVLRNYPAGK